MKRTHAIQLCPVLAVAGTFQVTPPAAGFGDEDCDLPPSHLSWPSIYQV